MSSCALFLYNFFKIPVCHYTFHAAFFPYCFLFIFCYFQCILFWCCTLFMLHFFLVALFPCCTLSMLQYFSIALSSCCTFSLSHFFRFPLCLSLSIFLFVLYFFLVSLFSFCFFFHIPLFSCDTFFMLPFFRIALFSCCFFCVAHFYVALFPVLDFFHVAWPQVKFFQSRFSEQKWPLSYGLCNLCNLEILLNDLPQDSSICFFFKCDSDRCIVIGVKIDDKNEVVDKSLVTLSKTSLNQHFLKSFWKIIFCLIYFGVLGFHCSHISGFCPIF